MIFRHRRYLMVFGVTTCALLASLAQSVSAQTNGVTIQNFAFAPSVLNIPIGATVQWTNQDTAAHTATSDTGAFDSGVLSQGSSYSFTFSQAGTFPYHCAIHPFMMGSIVVGGGAATSTPLPTSPPLPTTSPDSTPLPTNTAAPTATSTLAPSPVPPAPTATSAPALATLRVAISGKLKAGHSGTLQVTVKDAHGHAVKGAQVTANLHSVGGPSALKAKTSARGTARLTAKPKRAGSISIRVTKKGFTSRTVKVKVQR